MQFKTNLKCEGCVAAVTPALDHAVGAGNWQVDLESPFRILTVTAPPTRAADITHALDRLGYQAEEVKPV